MFKAIDKDIKLGLKRVSLAVDYLKLNQPHFKTVLIAGTNGKGTTAFYINNILKHHGYKVALFTSPHLINVNERLIIDGFPVDINLLKDTFEWIGSLSDKKGWNLTPFERFFLACFWLIFKKKDIEFFICEVGLGGRLDATNIINADLSVITSISYDHTDILGDDIRIIAKEKAGIIKNNSKVVIGNIPCEARSVIEDTLIKTSSSAYWMGEDFSYEIQFSSLEKAVFDWFGSGRLIRALEVPFGFTFLIHNISLSIMSSHLLIKLDEDRLRASLKDKLEGRCELLNYKGKKIVLDVAHNPSALLGLLKDLSRWEKDLIIFLSPLRDKNYEDMLKIAKLYGHVYLIPQDTERGITPEMVKDVSWIDLEEAFSLVEKRCALFVFTGSFWIVRKVKELFKVGNLFQA